MKLSSNNKLDGFGDYLEKRSNSSNNQLVKGEVTISNEQQKSSKISIKDFLNI
jgi:hypothetical protein